MGAINHQYPSPLRSPDFFRAVAHDAAGPDVPPEQVVMIGAAVVLIAASRNETGGFRMISVAKPKWRISPDKNDDRSNMKCVSPSKMMIQVEIM